jgi:hypothetical protein
VLQPTAHVSNRRLRDAFTTAPCVPRAASRSHATAHAATGNDRTAYIKNTIVMSFPPSPLTVGSAAARLGQQLVHHKLWRHGDSYYSALRLLNPR